MKVDIRVTENFKKAAKSLIKKYPSLKFELLDIEEELQSNPKMGTPIGSDCFKIRLAVKSKGKGKRGKMPQQGSICLELLPVMNSIKDCLQ